MKKIFTVAMLVLVSLSAVKAQDESKKFRAGLKLTGLPTWLKSGDPNTTKASTGFGFGFGLALEFKLTDVIYFSTGIGGDFENYSVKYRYDPFNDYVVGYQLDASNAFVEHTETESLSGLIATNPRFYTVSERKYKATYVTIPLALKMLTKEYSGFRYFGQFGGDIGVRAKLTADDQYVAIDTYQNISSNSGLNMKKDASLIPLRVGLNVGGGAEYRIAGSTSLFMSINYFRSFTNMMRKDSKVMASSADVNFADDKITFTRVKQSLIAQAIKINIGVMF